MNTNSEEPIGPIPDIQRIAKAIKEDRKQEDKALISNKAVASYEVTINNNIYTLWLVNGSLNSSVFIQKDFMGNPVINLRQAKTLKREGGNKTFSKNSIMAGHLIMSRKPSFSFEINGNQNNVVLLSQADYNPFNKLGDATNLSIRFKKEKLLYRYKSLSEILDQIDSKTDEIKELEKLRNYYSDKQKPDSEENIKKYLEKKSSIQQDLIELYKSQQDFIVEHARLKYKAILDPQQERIKRAHIYNDKIMLIEGGPGVSFPFFRSTQK